MILLKTFIAPSNFNYWYYNSLSETFDWVGYKDAEYIIDWFYSGKLNFVDYFNYCRYYLQPIMLKNRKYK